MVIKLLILVSVFSVVLSSQQKPEMRKFNMVEKEIKKADTDNLDAKKVKNISVIDGSWIGTVKDGGKVSSAELNLISEGKKLSGTLLIRMPRSKKFIYMDVDGRETDTSIILTGTASAGFSVQFNLEGTITKNVFSGSLSTTVSSKPGSFRFERVKTDE